MPEHQIKLTGWQAVIGLLILIGIIGVRLMTFTSGTDDHDLMEKIEFQLTTEYFPQDVDKLKSVLAAGDREEIDRTAKSITTSKLNIESIHTSYPLFTFTSNKKVIVKVTYSLDNAYGNREKGIKYYHFRHGSISNTWEYKYKSNAL